MKELIIFDLDGTLAKSKSPIDKEMADLLSSLLEVAQVAVISGGNWSQFEKQVLNHLPKKHFLKNYLFFPLAVLSITNSKKIGMSCMQRISPMKKRRKYWTVYTVP